MLKKTFLSVLAIVVAYLLFPFLHTSSTQAQQPIPFIQDSDQQTLYRDQISAYRDAERTFEIAKEQYFQLQTLAALEQAVSGTRNVLLARSKVLITYLEILRNELQLQHGINLQEKEDVLSRLDTQLDYLKAHQDQVLLANDREAILAVVTGFDQNQVGIEDAMYRARTLVAVGKVQTVNDKAKALLDDIKSEHAKEEVTSLVTSRRDRAYAETQRHIDQTESELIALMQEDYARNTKLFNKSRYDQITDKLSDPYVTAQQSLEFLNELLSL